MSKVALGTWDEMDKIPLIFPEGTVTVISHYILHYRTDSASAHAGIPVLCKSRAKHKRAVRLCIRNAISQHCICMYSLVYMKKTKKGKL